MDDFPEARKFYMERAYYRRIEFRRRQKNEISLDSKKHKINDEFLAEESENHISAFTDEEDLKQANKSDEIYKRRHEAIAEAIKKLIPKIFIL